MGGKRQNTPEQNYAFSTAIAEYIIIALILVETVIAGITLTIILKDIKSTKDHRMKKLENAAKIQNK
jgi:hypothetical protein